MAYTAPTTRATGFFVTAAVWNQDVVNNVAFLANPPACRVYHNANQSVADNTLTVVAFNSERYDTDTMHDTATNNSRITIKTAGIYIVSFHGRFPAASDYEVADCHLRLNGSTTIAPNSGGRAKTGSADLAVGVHTQYKFAVNDYIEVLVHQDNTANTARNLEAAGNYSPEFMAAWIGLG